MRVLYTLGFVALLTLYATMRNHNEAIILGISMILGDQVYKEKK